MLAGTPKAPRRRRLRRALKIALPAVAGVLLAGFLTWLGLCASARRAVERELERIRARGEPVRIADIVPPPVPDEENAAEILTKALAELDAARAKIQEDPSLVAWGDFLYGPSEPPEAFDPDKVGRALELYAEAMRLAREALKRPRCRFDLDYRAGYDMLLPHLTRLRQLGRLFRAEARLNLHCGKKEQAVASVDAIFRLAHLLDDEPIEVSKLVMFAVFGMGLRALREVEESAALTSPARERLVAELRGFDAKAMATRAMISQRVFILRAIDRVMEGRLDWVKVPPPWNKWAVRLLRFRYLRDEALYLECTAEYIESSRLPPWEAVGRFPQPTGPWMCLDPSWEAPFTSVLLSVSYYHRAVKLMALRDAAVLGLACELFRSKHGRYPARLEELAPEFLDELPPDPFTGKAFRYELRDGGKAFLVYSVGENLTDDDGVRDREKGKDDIAWEGGKAK